MISYAILLRTEKIIQANWHLTLRELHKIMQKMSMVTLHEAVTLGYSKLCAQWVPKMLVEKGKLK